MVNEQRKVMNMPISLKKGVQFFAATVFTIFLFYSQMRPCSPACLVSVIVAMALFTGFCVRYISLKKYLKQLLVVYLMVLIAVIGMDHVLWHSVNLSAHIAFASRCRDIMIGLTGPMWIGAIYNG